MSIQGKHVQNGLYAFSYMREPDSRTKCQIFQDAVYNPKNGTILGHTKKEWGRTGLFYLVFFSVLAVFFAICMKGLLATLNEDKPRWILESSIIGTSPGLGCRPLASNIEEQMLISYNSKNETDIEIWIQRIDTFLESYHNSSLLPGSGRNQQACDHNYPPRPGKVCMFDVDDIHKLGPCSYGKGYGFIHSQPCIFLKLNKIFGWTPNFYRNSNEIPSNMPETLKTHVENKINSGRIDNVWVSCQASQKDTNETLIDQINYYPESQGFPGYYYPYENQKGYLSPLVAVQFVKFKKNATIDVECQAWAQNIKTGNTTDEKAYRLRLSLRVNI